MPRTRPRRAALSGGPRRWVGAVALSLTLVVGLLAFSPAALATRPGTGHDGLDRRDAWLRSASSYDAVATSAEVGDEAPLRAVWRYPGGAEPVSTCDDRLCVHRVTSGADAATSAWAESTLAFFDAAWTTVVDELGYRAPRAAAGHDGDARFDVYLADLGGRGQHGFCAPGELVPGQDRRADSYCVIDNDMADTGGDRFDVLAATAAHEFFHAVQYNLDVGEDRWFMEATATWMEHQVFDSVHDNHRYVSDGQLGTPYRPLDSEAGMYGNWVFVEHLAERFGRDAVRQVWSRLDASSGGRDEWSLQGLVNHVQSRGTSWKTFYAGFAAANLTPRTGYVQDGLRAARPDLVLRLGRNPSGSARERVVQQTRVPHLATRTYDVRVAADSRARRVQLRLRSNRARSTAATLVVVRTDGTVRRQRLSFDRGVASTSVAVRPGRVRRVLVAVSHTSPAYARCGQGSGWSCGGEPVHREVKVRFRAVLR